jgi:hypothetical protein
VVDLAVVDHASHQRHRLVRHAEPERRVAGGEPCHAQEAHRVFDEGRGHVPKQAVFDVTRAVERVDEVTVLMARDRVDGEVAAFEVLLDRHARVGVKREAVVAASGLPLGAG